jgi:type I restriction enzyme S subunit
MANVGVILYADKGDIGNKKPEDLSKCKIVKRGDFVINSMNYGIGSYGVSRYDGVCSPVYIVMTPNEDAVEPSYAFRIFENKAFQTYAQSFGNGILSHRCAINWDILKAIAVPVPPKNEQRIILAFLDRETGKIDALVAEQERLIALLKEKRQAVISHAVTKGLNPNARMKDSGVQWLGEVPAHWLVSRCGYYFNVLPGFAFPSAGFSQDERDTRLLRGANVGVAEIRWDDVVYWKRTPNEDLKIFELSEGDLVLGMDRPWIAAGVRVAKLTASDVPSLLLQRTARISARSHVLTDLLELMLSSNFFISHFGPEMTGVSVPHISPDQIANFRMPIPPESEQADIVDYVKEVQQQLDQLMTEAKRAIALLSERRAALISAAVTGKIDVRDQVSALQAEAA